jgi:spermidine/putrescine transport system substrate-binding protein
LVPDSVLDAFRRRTGRAVERAGEATPAEIARAIREGGPGAPDLALLPGELVPELIVARRLARLDGPGIASFRHVAPAFRDLSLDPGNRHSVPLAYGMVGLVVRTDRLAALPMRWRDLAGGGFDGVVAARERARDVMGAALLALGGAGDGDDPADLRRAAILLTRLAVRLEAAERSAAAILDEPGTAILIGRGGDYRDASRAGLPVAFLLPDGGGLVWTEHWVIPAGGEGQAVALAFIDFCLQPEVAALVAREAGVAVANEALATGVPPAELADPITFPAPEALARSRLELPSGPAGQAALDAEWAALRSALTGASP